MALRRHLYTILFLLPIVCFGLTACEEEKAVKKARLYTGPLEEINNVEVLYSEVGVLKVKMKTPLQYKYQNNDRVYPKTVNIEFFGPDRQVVTTLRSDSGRYLSGKNIYRVMGNVVVVNKQKNEEMRTDELLWNPTTKKVYTDKKVNILSKNTGERLEGMGLDASQDFSESKIRQATGVFRINEQP